MTTVARTSSTDTAADPQIVAAIVTALCEVVGQELTDVTADTRLFDDLSLDSTAVLGLLMALEDALEMEVDPESLQQHHLESVGALAGFIAESR
ncbi:MULTISPECIES: acyl carrier protein [unclassified Streptomyces]|uniref:acyl carrier protein n=1 Tax=unclassified Streptomyces TaxID=2593676 RepID=UPI0007ED062D|nr:MULTISPECIES: acyl carrier protein [unclassified Streptomyces]MCP3768076.1 acyl carrier protein [Streptomyces sp. MAR25Y5]OBQ53059.1 phosphopantetheine-binding protein [Streptomyces sp. H-KF8]